MVMVPSGNLHLVTDPVLLHSGRYLDQVSALFITNHLQSLLDLGSAEAAHPAFTESSTVVPL